jgi:hypothetical protein
VLQRAQRAVRAQHAPHLAESTRVWKARFQDWIQPAWTRFAGGCHPNRETERLVEGAGFAIDADSRRAAADLRRFVARPARGADAVSTMKP